MEFCRYAAERRARRGLGKPETFTFLGFVFICGKSRRGAFLLRRQTRGDRVRAALQAIKSQLRVRMHDAIPDQGRWLKAVVTDYFAYHAVPTNSRALVAFRHHFLNSWRRTLERRSQKAGVTWAWGQARCGMAAATSHSSSVADGAVRRQTPKVGAQRESRTLGSVQGAQQWVSYRDR